MRTINIMPGWAEKVLLAGVLALNCVPESAEARAEAGPNWTRDEISQVLNQNRANGEVDGQQEVILDGGETSIESVYPNAIPAGDEYLNHCDANMREFRGRMKDLKLNEDYCFIKGAKKDENCSNVDEEKKYTPANLDEVYITENRGMIGGCFHFKGNASHQPHWAFQILGPKGRYSDPNKEYDVIFSDSSCRDASFCANREGK